MTISATTYGKYENRNYGINTIRVTLGNVVLYFSKDRAIALETPDGYFVSEPQATADAEHLSLIPHDQAECLGEKVFEFRVIEALANLGSYPADLKDLLSRRDEAIMQAVKVHLNGSMAQRDQVVALIQNQAAMFDSQESATTSPSSTGMTDTNGKTIYEGDTVTFKVENDDAWIALRRGTIVYDKRESDYVIDCGVRRVTIGKGYDAYPGTLTVIREDEAAA